MPELPSNVFGPLLAMTVVFVIDWRMGRAGLATIPVGVLFYSGMMRGYQEKMGEVRREEMANAARALGVQHRWLGHVDSGLPDPVEGKTTEELLPEGCLAAHRSSPSTFSDIG